MILLVALVLLVLVVGVAAVGVSGLFGNERARSGQGLGIGAALTVPAVAVGGVVVMLVIVVIGLGGARSGRTPAIETPAPVERDEARDAPDPAALEGPPATFDGRVSIDAASSRLRPLPTVSGLDAGDVVEVRAGGFLGHAEGAVAQCTSADAPVCRNVARATTDGEGRLRVPYRIEGRGSGDVLVVEVDLERGAARLAFGATSPPAALLTVTDGSTVAIRGATPGERVSVRRCAADADAAEECSEVATVTVTDDGTATAPLGAATDESEQLTLVNAAGNVLVEPVRVAAARPASAEVDLDATRLLMGFAIALFLVGIAVAIIRTTDWRAPSEASTPFLDAATFDA